MSSFALAVVVSCHCVCKQLTYSDYVQRLKMRLRTRPKMKQSGNTGGAIGAASTLINPVLHLKFKLCLLRRVALAEVLDLNAVMILIAAVTSVCTLISLLASACKSSCSNDLCLIILSAVFERNFLERLKRLITIKC